MIIGMLMINWLVFQIKKPTVPVYSRVISLFGVAGYLFIPYSLNIWQETTDAETNLADTLIG